MGYKIKKWQSAYGKAHYKKYLAKYTARDVLYREELRHFLETAKNKPCAICGGTFLPCAMDFHHRDRTSKTQTVAAYRYISKKFIAEIAKCDLLCANCHRIEHFRLGTAMEKPKPPALDKSTKGLRTVEFDFGDVSVKTSNDNI
jgi:hypothetical protein